jgi:hypothetical protein
MSNDSAVSSPGQTSLQQLVVRRLHDLGDATGPMSARAAAARSRGLVSYETLRVIARGDHSGRISDDTAQGLAFALDVPLSQVYEAMSTPQPTKRWELPARFDRLSPAQRKVVESVAAAMLEAYEQGQRNANG